MASWQGGRQVPCWVRLLPVGTGWPAWRGEESRASRRSSRKSAETRSWSLPSAAGTDSKVHICNDLPFQLQGLKCWLANPTTWLLRTFPSLRVSFCLCIYQHYHSPQSRKLDTFSITVLLSDDVRNSKAVLLIWGFFVFLNDKELTFQFIIVKGEVRFVCQKHRNCSKLNMAQNKKT